ncbi:MAG: transcription elongation factor GreA [Thermomicrobiales bacterium]
MAEPIPITKEGLERLKSSSISSSLVRRQIIKAIAAAREEGDLRENAGYDAARHDQAMTERRIREIEDRIRRAQIIDPSKASSVQVGTYPRSRSMAREREYTIVAARLRRKPGRSSNGVTNRQGGRKKGDVVDIRTPTTVLQARVVSVNGSK